MGSFFDEFFFSDDVEVRERGFLYAIGDVAIDPDTSVLPRDNADGRIVAQLKVAPFRYSWRRAFAVSLALRITHLFALSTALLGIRERPQPQHAKTCYKAWHMRTTGSTIASVAVIIYARSIFFRKTNSMWAVH